MAMGRLRGGDHGLALRKNATTRRKLKLPFNVEGLSGKRIRNLRIAAAGEPLHPLPLSAGLSPSHRIDFLAVFSKACGRVGIVEIWAGAIDLRRHGVPRGLPSQ